LKVAYFISLEVRLLIVAAVKSGVQDNRNTFLADSIACFPSQVGHRESKRVRLQAVCKMLIIRATRDRHQAHLWAIPREAWDVGISGGVHKPQRFCRDAEIFLRKGVDRTIAALHNCNPSKQPATVLNGTEVNCFESLFKNVTTD